MTQTNTRTSDYLQVRFHGLELRIYCTIMKFVKRYDRWYVRDSVRSMYHVSAEINELPFADVVVDEEVLSEIRHAIDFKTELPALLPENMSFNHHKTAAAHAYIDLATQRLKKLKNNIH